MRVTIKQLIQALSNRRARLKVLRVATVVNAALLVALHLAETRLAERTWLTGGLAYVPQCFFGIPLAILLIWSVAERRRWIALANAAIALAFVFTLLSFNVPLDRSHGGRTIRVMTYNLRQGARGIREIARVIQDVNPDILCVQEVNSWDKWGDPVWQLQQLMLGWHMVRDGELAILSRYPILSSAVHYLPANTQRAILEARIRIRGREITVLTTHFNVAAEQQLSAWGRAATPNRVNLTAAVMAAQAWELIRVASAGGDSLIITGDLNMPSRWLAYREIAGRYSDAFRAAGWGFGYTFPADLPLSRIDYILLGRSLGARRCFVPRTRASDHRPVVADLVLR